MKLALSPFLKLQVVDWAIGRLIGMVVFGRSHTNKSPSDAPEAGVSFVAGFEHPSNTR
jgi:hypothetical protein